MIDSPKNPRIRLERMLDVTSPTGSKVEELKSILNTLNSPIDIAVVLNTGLEWAYILAAFRDDNNFLLFRPESTNKSIQKEVRFLDGTPSPSRDLLLFDDDCLYGNTMVESYHYFSNLGYNPNRIYVYLVNGYCQNNIRGESLSGRLNEVFRV